MSARDKLAPETEADTSPADQAAATAARLAGSPALRLLGYVGHQMVVLPWIGVLIGIVLIGTYVSFEAPCSGGAFGRSCFLTSDNLLTVAQEFSYVGIAALGGAMVIMTRGIDLSVGANMA
ncbi:MAG: hypothetical protein JOZ41_20085, partial [Chloroflexi bacterium]|nr:hypothetical protein [Chloroflexota bacterium]